MTIVTEIAATPVDEWELANLPRSDLGNAQRLQIRFGENLRYVPEQGWHAWDGKRWAGGAEGEAGAMRYAHAVAEAALAEVEAILERGKFETEEPKDFDRRVAAARKWAVDSGNSIRTRAMLAQAANYLRRDRTGFDEDPLKLNCQNGTLVFEKTADGVNPVLRAHTRSDYLTALAGCDYDPAADAPVWRAHLEMCVPDAEKRDYFQRFCGYCLTGLISETMFLILQGGGSDGKSTTINALLRMMGEYAMSVDIKSFIQNDFRGGADASPDIARLAGPVRMVGLSEPKRGSKLDDAAIKTMTGGDRIVARHLRQGIFEFIPVYKMMLPCNPLPIITSSDHGIWRRVKLMEWTHRIEDAEKDREIDRKLKAEASGILNWAIEGLADYLHEYLAEPDCIRQAVKMYRAESDPITMWVDERCDLGRGYRERLADLYKDYSDWSEDNNLNAIPNRAFGANLTAQNYKSVRIGGQTFKNGIRLEPGRVDLTGADFDQDRALGGD